MLSNAICEQNQTSSGRAQKPGHFPGTVTSWAFFLTKPREHRMPICPRKHPVTQQLHRYGSSVLPPRTKRFIRFICFMYGHFNN